MAVSRVMTENRSLGVCPMAQDAFTAMGHSPQNINLGKRLRAEPEDWANLSTLSLQSVSRTMLTNIRQCYQAVNGSVLPLPAR